VYERRQFLRVNTSTMPKSKPKMAQATDKAEAADTNGVDDHSPPEMSISSTIEELQTDEQRRVLDIVSQVRKCGLESVLSLPQIVVCGDQSAGKSSVLEALTEIPFPRNDNLCTRFATEICLRRDPIDSLTIRVIPDSDRPQEKQDEIKNFSKSISDFTHLPEIINLAMEVMGISEGGSAFAKDTLSVEICGPNRPQLTLVDIPGLIQASTKGVSERDVGLVAEITDYYIQQPRTICLAVISATHDAANQPILQRVRKFDPQGDRTLGVITKPDRLSPGSGSESKFLELARNEDVFFKLGWHVIKNRKFEESKFSIEERNMSEKAFFAKSNFNTLSKENLGIDTLRARLSYLLFEHVKNELPRLQRDLESALKDTQDELKKLGDSRSTVSECRTYLTRLNMECFDICRAAIEGNYEHDYFTIDSDNVESLRTIDLEEAIIPLRRLRASLQLDNSKFSKTFEARGHKYEFGSDECHFAPKDPSSPKGSPSPQRLTKDELMAWVANKLRCARGKELIGNYNPRVIGELFWEQSEPWEKMARAHVEKISKNCEGFLAELLNSMTAKELQSRIW
jgi:GTPase SAR1 family protein